MHIPRLAIGGAARHGPLVALRPLSAAKDRAVKIETLFDVRGLATIVTGAEMVIDGGRLLGNAD